MTKYFKLPLSAILNIGDIFWLKKPGEQHLGYVSGSIGKTVEAAQTAGHFGDAYRPVSEGSATQEQLYELAGTVGTEHSHMSPIQTSSVGKAFVKMALTIVSIPLLTAGTKALWQKKWQIDVQNAKRRREKKTAGKKA